MTICMLSRSHPFFQTFVELMTRAAQHEPIYDLGTSGRFAKEMAFVEPLFVGKAYSAGGYEPDFAIDRACDFHSDVQNLDQIADASVGSVISLEVLEHVQDPRKTIEETFRILKQGGVCVLSTPFMAGYHGKTARAGEGAPEAKNDHASYADYWRFTHEGLQHLFTQAGFSQVTVYPVNGPLSARLEFLKLGPVLQKLPFIAKFVQKIEKPRLGKLTTRHFVIAVK